MDDSEKTTEKRAEKFIPVGVEFNSERQPTPEAKSLGWKKKRQGRELAKAVLELAFKGMKNSELKKAAAEYFSIAEHEITVEMMLLFRQAEKAIQKADTAAFRAVMERAHGLPKQDIELSGNTIEIIVSSTKKNADIPSTD